MSATRSIAAVFACLGSALFAVAGAFAADEPASAAAPAPATESSAAAPASPPEAAPGPGPAADPRSETEAAVLAAQRAAVSGPHEVVLRDQAMLQMPAKFAYIPADESRRLLQAMGNQPGPNLLGMIVPDGGGEEGEEASWIVVMEYVDSGHIKEDDAKEWNADELLKNLREGTEQGNEERRKRGMGELQVLRWIEPPQYAADTHRLVWSAATKDKDDPGDAPRGVNYNTYALGREGYVSLNLVTGYDTIEKDKPVARQLLAALQFKEGRRYTDFTETTDRVAEYGLAALVGGIAAKKLGLLALAGAFLLKFAKIIGVAAFAALGIGAKWLGRKKKDDGDSAS